MAIPAGILFKEPYYKPLDYNSVLPNAQLFFLRSGSAGPAVSPATVYQDGALTTPYAQPLIADANGRFSPIYLTPGVAYRVKLFDNTGALKQDVDPYIAQPPSFNGVIVKAVDTAATATTTLVQDPELVMSIPYPGVYKIDLVLGYSISNVGNNGGIALAVDFSNGMAVQVNGVTESMLVLTGNLNGTKSNNNVLTPIQNQNASGFLVALALVPQNQDPTINFVHLHGYLQAQTDGILSLYNAQNSSNLAPTTLRKGSALLARQVQ